MCSICSDEVYARGWCRAHYIRWWKYGDPTATPKYDVIPGTLRSSLSDRFWVKVDRRGPDECWEWKAFRKKEGYGMIGEGGAKGRPLLAHRVSYELLVGPIPDGLQLDHLCRNRGCVNPSHLEPVTLAENVLRGESIAAKSARKTHCVNGHEFTDENTYKPKSGGRYCRTCRRNRTREYNRSRRKVG